MLLISEYILYTPCKSKSKLLLHTFFLISTSISIVYHIALYLIRTI